MSEIKYSVESVIERMLATAHMDRVRTDATVEVRALFGSSAIHTHYAMLAGVSASAVAKAAQAALDERPSLKGTIGLYTSDTSVKSHALTGQVLLLAGDLPEFTTIEGTVEMRTPQNVQALIAALTRPVVNGILSDGKVTTSARAFGALKAAVDAKRARIKAAAVAAAETADLAAAMAAGVDAPDTADNVTTTGTATVETPPIAMPGAGILNQVLALVIGLDARAVLMLADELIGHAMSMDNTTDEAGWLRADDAAMADKIVWTLQAMLATVPIAA